MELPQPFETQHDDSSKVIYVQGGRLRGFVFKVSHLHQARAQERLFQPRYLYLPRFSGGARPLQRASNLSNHSTSEATKGT